MHSTDFNRQAFYFKIAETKIARHENSPNFFVHPIDSVAKGNTRFKILDVSYQEFKEHCNRRGNNHPEINIKEKIKTLIFGVGSLLTTICIVATRIVALAIGYITFKIRNLNPLYLERLKIIHYCNLRDLQSTYGDWAKLFDRDYGVYHIQESEFYMSCYTSRWNQISKLLSQERPQEN